MRYKYYYYVSANSRLIEFLDANCIRYKIDESKITTTKVIFSLWSSSANTPALVENLASLCRRDPIITLEFSEAELEQSKFLVVKPKKQKIEITNAKDSFAHSCEMVDSFGITRVEHEWQIGTLAIAKEPSMKTNTALWASDSGFAEIFADSRVYELVASNALSGIKFEKVLLKDGTYSNKIYQMTSQHLIQQETISLGHGEKVQKCPLCGKEQFYIDSSYQLHLNDIETLLDSDFYSTDRIFGDGIAEPFYIISQRFYQLLKKNNLARSVSFSPVVDASKQSII